MLFRSEPSERCRSSRCRTKTRPEPDRCRRSYAKFSRFFVIVHNFEATVTVPQHTVVVPKPACSYQNYTTFQRYFQGFSQFCVLELSYLLYHFYAHIFSCDLVRHSSERPGPGASAGAFALPRCAPQGGCDEGLDDGLMGVLMDGIE